MWILKKKSGLHVLIENDGLKRTEYGNLRFKTRFFYNSNINENLRFCNNNEEYIIEYKTRRFYNKKLI